MFHGVGAFYSTFGTPYGLHPTPPAELLHFYSTFTPLCQNRRRPDRAVFHGVGAPDTRFRAALLHFFVKTDILKYILLSTAVGTTHPPVGCVGGNLLKSPLGFYAQ